MCHFLSQTSSHACFSFSPYGLGFGLPVGPRGTQAKAAYRVICFSLMQESCEALYGFPGAADTKYHKTCGLKPKECFVSQSWRLEV